MSCCNSSVEEYDDLIVQIAHYTYTYDVKQDSAAIEAARLSLLDALGCATETLSSQACPTFIGPNVPNTITRNGFRLPGTSYELDPIKGAFDLSVLIRYLDHNDGLTGAEWGHPSGE